MVFMNNNTKNNTLNLKDNCPEWADVLINQLCQVEIFLGNISKNLDWESQYLKKYQSRAFFPSDEVFDDKKVEFIFKKIVTQLHKEKFSVNSINKFINKRISTGSSLPYCSPEEINAVI